MSLRGASPRPPLAGPRSKFLRRPRSRVTHERWKRSSAAADAESRRLTNRCVAVAAPNATPPGVRRVPSVPALPAPRAKIAAARICATSSSACAATRPAAAGSCCVTTASPPPTHRDPAPRSLDGLKMRLARDRRWAIGAPSRLVVRACAIRSTNGATASAAARSTRSTSTRWSSRWRPSSKKITDDQIE